MNVARAMMRLIVPEAEAATTDLVVHCDPPLAGPLRSVAAAFRRQSGVQLRIFATAPNAISAQLVREIQNDIVVSQPGVLAQIKAADLLADVAQAGPWRNRLVIAARRGAARPPIGQARVAAPDPGWGGGPDGPALLAQAGITPAHRIGTFDTGEARTILLSGEADYALLHATELTAELEVVEMPGFGPELRYFAAQTRASRRPDPGAVMRFLATAEAGAALRDAGLELAT
jgi:molybdate transport system substrate-binding protein